jgi:hypothetical protein
MRKNNKVKTAKARDLRQAQRKRTVITLPADSAAQRGAINKAFTTTAGASVFARQMHPFINADNPENECWIAGQFIEAICESVQPRDVIEKMLVVQMVWTHARLARLSSIAHDQEHRENVQVVHDACDKAANTFRRQMLTLAEYRRPAQPSSFVAIRQANLANQQVVQNAEEPNFQNGITSNEQGSPAALPPVPNGVEVSAGNSGDKQAVASKHRAKDGSRKGTIQAERNEAR